MTRRASGWSGRHTARERRRTGRLRPLIASAAFTLAAAGAAVLADSHLGHPVSRVLGPAPERLLPAVAVHGSGGSYRFTRTQDDGHAPVTFDPCRRVEIVYNPEHAPPGTEILVEEALAEVARRTGLDLALSGLTDERPRQERPARDEARYGAGWSPVLLAWSTAPEMPGLAGPVAGLGGSIAKAPLLSSHLTYVSGSVTLDAVDLGAAMRGPDGPWKVRAILMHELAHLVGLDHVEDPDELMRAENRGQASFGPGDLEGLARLGSGDCRG